MPRNFPHKKLLAESQSLKRENTIRSSTPREVSFTELYGRKCPSGFQHKDRSMPDIFGKDNRFGVGAPSFLFRGPRNHTPRDPPYYFPLSDKTLPVRRDRNYR